MPFEQFYKYTFSRSQAAMPDKSRQWIETKLRAEWTKAKDAGEALQLSSGGPAPADFKIQRNESSLSPEERTVEERFAQAVEGDPQKYVDEYRQRFGNVVSSDLSKEMSPDYNATRESRSAHSRSAHEPASAVAKLAWKEMLAEPPETNGTNGTVVFTSGGTGVGKTSAIGADRKSGKVASPVLKSIADHADIVYDGNLATPEPSIRKVNEALESGRNVTIIHTERDPVTSMIEGVIPRAEKPYELGGGRIVTIEDLVGTHAGSARTFAILRKHFADDPRVKIFVIDNNSNPHGVREPRILADHELDDFEKRIAARTADRPALRSEILAAVIESEKKGKVTPYVAGKIKASEVRSTPGIQRSAGEAGGRESQAAIQAGSGPATAINTRSS